MSQPFVVPDVSGTMPSIAPMRIPDVFSGENVTNIPAWTYKKISALDIFQSKLGISATTAIIPFSLLAYMNPPFIQQRGENEIETRKPSVGAMYAISIAVFILFLIILINPPPLGSRGA